MVERRPIDPAEWARAHHGEDPKRKRREEVVDEPAELGPDETAPVTTTFPNGDTRVTGRRALAHLLDGAIFSLIAGIVVVAAAISSSNALLVIVALLVVIPGHIAYFVLTQRANGRSPGKWWMRLRVVDAEGAVPSVGALVRRSIPLLFEYLYVISLTAILSSPDRQRLGDRWADTYVIADEDRERVADGG